MEEEEVRRTTRRREEGRGGRLQGVGFVKERGEEDVALKESRGKWGDDSF